MNIDKTGREGGSLRISSDVIEKLARYAALEVKGIREVSCGNSPVKTAFARASIQKPVSVTLTDEVAEITVHVIVEYGVRIPSACTAVQKNVKSAVQNMTGIAVSGVNVVIAGVHIEPPDEGAGQ